MRFSSFRREQRYSTLCFLYKSDTEGEINKCCSTILSFQFKSDTERRVEISVTVLYDSSRKTLKRMEISVRVPYDSSRVTLTGKK